MPRRKFDANQRAHDIARVGHLYRYVEPYGPDVCVYCGDPATSIDHVTNVSHVVTLLDTMEHFKDKLRHGLVTVPCCSDCNMRLANFVAYNITSKREELKKRLRKKYQKVLGAYDWQPEEIAEHGPSLQVYLANYETKRDWIWARIQFPRRWESLMLRTAAQYK